MWFVVKYKYELHPMFIDTIGIVQWAMLNTLNIFSKSNALSPF